MNQKPIYFSVFVMTLFTFFSCQYVSFLNKSTLNLNKYDGSYSIAFTCGDICMANAIIEITDGKIDGEVNNIKQQSFLVIGYAENTGDLQLQSISENSEEIIEANGSINSDSIVSGTYSVGDRNCKMFGFRYTRDKDKVVKKYDGTYELELTRAGKKVDTIQIQIQNGLFHSNVTTSTNITYQVNGNISQNGHIIANTLFSNKDKGLTVIGSIQENGTISGDYYKNPGVKGEFFGKKIIDN